jgi:threonine/homoserine/homoserine lactone efflux protein
MLTWHAFALYCGLYAIAIAVPGPGIVNIVARALGGGFRSTWPAIAGIVAGDLILMTLSVLGLALVAKAMGGFFLVIKLAGAAYLIYLAYKYWTARTGDLTSTPPTSVRQGFAAQLMITLGNPKAIAFFAALLPTVIDLHRVTLAVYAQLVFATLVLIPSITLVYAALASRVRGLMTSARAQKRINRTAAVVMAGAGLGVAVT